MEMPEILVALERCRDILPREAFEEAVRRREEITPHLLDALRDTAERIAEFATDAGWFMHVSSMYLLAQFREQRAFPLIIDICTQPKEHVDAVLDDIIPEDLARILASVYNGEIVLLQALAENRSLDEYVRGAGVRCISILALENIVPRGEVIEYFAALFRGKLEDEPSFVWDALAEESVNLYAGSLADDIRRGYETGLISPEYIEPGWMEKSLAMPEEDVLSRSRDASDGLIENAAGELESWACFNSEWDEPHSDDAYSADSDYIGMAEDDYNGNYYPDEERPQPIVGSRDIAGPNDSCPCGSGKKYKKCCRGRTDDAPAQRSTAVKRQTGGAERASGQPRCGLCGKTGNLTRTECCGNWICNDADQYIPFSYAATSCYRNHKRYTLCGSHHAERHPGSWKNCALCRENVETEMYVWYGTNEFNFEKLANPPAYEPTRCSGCGNVIALGTERHAVQGDSYWCGKCSDRELARKLRQRGHC